MSTQQNNTATLCKSNATRIPNIYSEITSCSNTEEITRRNTFASDVGKQMNEIENLKSMYVNALTTADSIFGSASTTTFAKEIDIRNRELKDRVSKLGATIDTSKSAIERSERDFIDSKEQLPEQLPTHTIHVIDDYTLSVLSVAYIFFIFAVIYWYVQQNDYSMRSILTALGSAVILTLIIVMLLIAYL
jgi:hypothetical protein